MSAVRTLLLAFGASLALSGAAHRPATVFDLSDDVGKAAPAVTLAVDDGAPIALGALRGKPTYVLLFAGWCEPCRRELPFVRSAYAKYRDRVNFVGVDVLEDAAAARAAIAAAALPFPVAIYPIDQLDTVVPPGVQLSSGAKYQIPAEFLLDANGIVRYAWHGLAIDNDDTAVDVLPSYLAKLGID